MIGGGCTVDAVDAILGKWTRKGTGGLSFGTYPQYVDPHNPANAYSRGPVSVWLKYKMVVVGRDPADQAEPEEFETAHLNLVA